MQKSFLAASVSDDISYQRLNSVLDCEN